MKNYFEKIENKLKEHLKFEDLIIIDNTHLHVKHNLTSQVNYIYISKLNQNI